MGDLDSFRQDVRQWLLANVPQSLVGTRTGRFDGYWGGQKATGTPPDVKRWFDVMLQQGWVAPSWPKEYGGGGCSRDEEQVIHEELAALKIPSPLVGFGLAMIGPTLLDYGTDEQKNEHLLKTIQGQVRWCQGYSEPGSGSDLASLSTKAIRDGDDFVINGQKVWTSHADRSDWIFCLVRTDFEAKKQSGITFILIDMNTPGVSTRGIQLISGASPFCEVFFEDVRVPAQNVVGDINGGWTIAKALLGYERSVIGEAISSQLSNAESELVTLARKHGGPADGPLASARLREAIAQNAMDEACFAQTLQRIREGQEDGRGPGPESSILKIAGSELKQRRWELAVDIAGPDAVAWGDQADADLYEANSREWLRSRANTIEGGTSEIQLNIIAKRVLGLPT